MDSSLYNCKAFKSLEMSTQIDNSIAFTVHPSMVKVVTFYLTRVDNMTQAEKITKTCRWITLRQQIPKPFSI